MKILPSKNISEAYFISFDFSDTLYVESIESATVMVDYFSGIGGNPASEILEGLPIVSGLTIKQKLKQGGVPYTTYKLKCIAFISTGNILTKEAVISVDGYMSDGSESFSSTP